MALPGHSEDFEGVAWCYDRLPVPTHPKALRNALAGKGGVIIDLGGGTGKYTAKVVTSLDTAVVVDGSRKMLRRAAEKRGLATLQAAADRIPLREEAADVVLCTEAFHHFVGIQDEVLDEVARILKPGGMFLLEEPDPTRFLGRLMRWGEHVQGWDSRFHPPATLAAMLEKRFATVRQTRSGLFTVLMVAQGPR